VTDLERKEVSHGRGRPPTVSKEWEEYESVKTWRSGLEKSTFSPYYYIFTHFMQYLRASGTQFASMNPDQLIEYQEKTQGRKRYEILTLVQTWAQSDRELRKSHIQNRVKAIRSFFTRNRAELPVDRGFRARSDTPPLPSDLKVEDIKKVLDKSNKAFRAVFMVMFQTFMDQDTLERWSDKGWKDLKPQLDKGVDQVVIKVPGRKGSKNEDWFETRLGGDGLKFLRDYIADERGPEPGPVFYNQFGGRLQKKAVKTYWTRKLKDAHLVEPQEGKVVRYGKGLHQMRDVARSLWQMNAPDSIALAETMMGHEITGDKNGYVHLTDEAWKREKYAAVLPFLNLWSSSLPYGLAPKEDVAAMRKQLQDIRVENERLRTEALARDEATRALEQRQEQFSREMAENKTDVESRLEQLKREVMKELDDLDKLELSDEGKEKHPFVISKTIHGADGSKVSTTLRHLPPDPNRDNKLHVNFELKRPDGEPLTEEELEQQREIEKQIYDELSKYYPDEDEEGKT
jgi:hypothetical protein